MSKEEIEIIEACTTVDESFVKQARELLAREEGSEMTKMFKIILDHNEKTSGEVKLCKYRKVVITTRGYYFFRDPFAAGTNEGRALFEGGYYY